MFACAVPMFFYKITEKKQAEMVAEVEARKLAAGVVADSTGEAIEVDEELVEEAETDIGDIPENNSKKKKK